MKHLFLSCILCIATSALAEPISLQLDKQASRVDFTFRSQLLSTQGEFSDYSGSLLYDTKNLASSKLEIAADPSRVSFGNLPIDKMILLNSLIRSMSTSQVTFVSDSFEKSTGDTIIINGTTTAGRNRERVRLPVTISQGSGKSELKGTYERSGLIGNPKNPTSLLFGDATCKARFAFVFRK